MSARSWSGVRWREDTGWELRCESCVIRGGPGGAYWPIGFEFWNPHRSMVRCRACWRIHQNARERSRRALLSSAEIARRNEAVRVYRREWARRKRRYEREAEGRQRYERRKVA